MLWSKHCTSPLYILCSILFGDNFTNALLFSKLPCLSISSAKDLLLYWGEKNPKSSNGNVQMLRPLSPLYHLLLLCTYFLRVPLNKLVVLGLPLPCCNLPTQWEIAAFIPSYFPESTTAPSWTQPTNSWFSLPFKKRWKGFATAQFSKCCLHLWAHFHSSSGEVTPQWNPQ